MQVVKAGEPACSVILLTLFFGRKYSKLVWLTLIPIVGGVALIDIVLYFQLAVIPTAGGTANWNPAIPAIPSLVGLTVYSQAAALDGSQPAGWALSNGVQLTICP